MLLRLLSRQGSGERIKAMFQRSARLLTVAMLGSWAVLLLASRTGLLDSDRRTAAAVAVAVVTWLWFWAVAATGITTLAVRITGAVRRRAGAR